MVESLKNIRMTYRLTHHQRLREVPGNRLNSHLVAHKATHVKSPGRFNIYQPGGESRAEQYATHTLMYIQNFRCRLRYRYLLVANFLLATTFATFPTCRYWYSTAFTRGRTLSPK